MGHEMRDATSNVLGKAEGVRECQSERWNAHGERRKVRGSRGNPASIEMLSAGCPGGAPVAAAGLEARQPVRAPRGFAEGRPTSKPELQRKGAHQARPLHIMALLTGQQFILPCPDW